MDLNNPYQIKLNNTIKQSQIKNHYLTIELEKGLNIIEIIWNYSLTNLKWMFDHCKEIESIDFSNFDFSQVKIC